MLLGIDTGGTFTDFVWFDGERIQLHKVLSTPAAPEKAILQGIRELQIALPDIQRVVHGSTVATNAVLEGKGVRTVYITNRGLGDVLTIGRQSRPALYELKLRCPPPPVPADHCLETGGRLGADGRVVEALSGDDLSDLLQQVNKLQPTAAAINLLYSFLDDRFEREIEAALPESLFVSRSSAILPEQKEYERGITTWLNAYVGPLVEGYLQRLGQALAPAHLAVMRSSGQTANAGQAGQEAVHLLLSGPAGGLSAARFIGGLCGEPRLLTFDMGGTSTDVALIDAEIALTSCGRIGHYPIAVPMVDMHTIGAGGGSLAYADPGGALQVGPESAGADPGPACYGKGGEQPTVTDANLVLGRIPREARLAGKLPLDYQAAYSSLSRLAEQLGLESAEEAASGVIRIADEHMTQALRVISIQQGADPREFALMAFGGAGGLHLCALAEALGMTRAVAPINAGVLSALGMLTAPAGKQLSKTLGITLSECPLTTIETAFAELAEQGEAALQAEGLVSGERTKTASVDLCYRGQSFTLNLPWQGKDPTCEAFQQEHESRYGHRLSTPVELVNVRLGISVKTAAPELADMPVTGKPGTTCQVHGIDQPVPVYPRQALATKPLAGPLIVMDDHATVFVAPGWRCQRDNLGNLLLRQR
jgi:N-methylhydantoinase A